MLSKFKSPESAQKRRNPRDRDESPMKVSPSPRAVSQNNSYYANNNTSAATSGSGNVKVVCRVRPSNQKELELGGPIAVTIEDDKTVCIKSSQYIETGSSGLTFTFDKAFGPDSAQEEIYEFTAKPVVESVLEGFNGTVFAYGQTSSGKTYTMMGPNLDDAEYCGIIPRMVGTVFDYISDTPDHIEFTVKVSIIEIYMERIRDLLNPKKVNLKIREDKTKGIYIEDVTESYVSDESDVYDFLRYGNNNRKTTTTNMNETSSRSHCLFMMTIHQNNLLEMNAKTGKLYLVDLAGSEKVGKTGAVGQVLEEAKEINKSLSALGNVINALTDSKGLQHIPYRDSKLTRILQESLGGNSRTSLIINCSPSAYNEMETLSALRFGYRAKSIKNSPKVNREYTAAQLQILLEKAEKKIVIKDRRIKVLEEILCNNYIEIPEDVQASEIQPSPNKRKNNSYLETEEGADLSDNEGYSKTDVLSPLNSRANKGGDQERIKALEDELRIERLSLHKQTDKVRLFKKDLEEANTKMFMLEKENEALINKLATQSLKLQEFQEKLRDKEMKLEILQLLKDILTTENEELKKSRKSFLQDLDEENKEVLKLAQTEGLMTPRRNKDKDPRIQKELLEELAKKKEAYFTTIDNVSKDLVKDMVQKLSVRDLTALKGLMVPHMNKLKDAFLSIDEAEVKKPKEGGSEIKKKYEKLKEELASEKQKNSKNRNDYEAFLKDHDNLSRSNVPSFDEWRQGIGIDTSRVDEMLLDGKDETLIFKDFFGAKNNKEMKLALNLENFKEKKKGNIGSKQPEMISARGDGTPKVNEEIEQGSPKSPLKTQRMINLEKQLHETKELVNQYKNKIESLKSLITTTSAAPLQPVKMDSSEKLENMDSFKQHKQIIKQEVVNEVNEEKNFEDGELSPKSSVKIVKPIKGGQIPQNKKGSIASQKFFDILKQQYRFNRNFVNGIGGESILNKQKPSTSATASTSKLQSEGKLKGV